MKIVFLGLSAVIAVLLVGMLFARRETGNTPVTPPPVITSMATPIITKPDEGIMQNETMDKPKRNEIVLDQPPPMQIDADKSYIAILKTDKGDIQVSLNAKQTPITVNNFVALSKLGFYYQTIFHRVIDGFMIQGGDPKGDGTGGPGYSFDDEPFTGEYTRGTVAMANSGPDTNGSQFFIMQADRPLPKNYVIFGTVIQGMEVVDAIAKAPVTAGPGGENSKPITPVVIQNIQITEK